MLRKASPVYRIAPSNLTEGDLTITIPMQYRQLRRVMVFMEPNAFQLVPPEGFEPSPRRLRV